MDNDFSTYSRMDDLIVDLQSLIRQPSISSNNYGISECAKLVANLMIKAGIRSDLFFLQDKKIPPMVYGEVKSKTNPNGKTLLFYNHYDTQPTGTTTLWKYHPFSGTRVGNKVFGRGSSDDKGELVTRIKAIEHQLRTTGDVPCNIKLIIEGEEEIGSPHLQEYFIAHQHKLKCDAVVWESGYINERGRPVITLGTKGLLYVELTAIGPLMDTHSSLAVLIQNPVWRLVNALNAIWNDCIGKVRIEDWYKEVIEFTPEELQIIKEEPFDEQSFKKKYGISRFINDIAAIEIQKTLAGKSTCNIACICSGHPCKLSKSIIPSTATIRLDFRLVPNMSPRMQYQRLKLHLNRSGFQDIETKLISSIPAARTSIHHSFVKTVIDSTKKAYDKVPIIRISSSGSGPMYLFKKFLNVPCVSVGCTYIYSNIHSIDEFARLDLLQRGTNSIINIIRLFSIQQTDAHYIDWNDNNYSPFNLKYT